MENGWVAKCQLEHLIDSDISLGFELSQHANLS